MNIAISSAYAQDVTVSGYVYYHDTDQNDATVPIRNATVKIYDFDTENDLATSTTDENGYYQFIVVDNGGTGLDVFIRVYADNSVVDVVDDLLNTYTFESDDFLIFTDFMINWTSPPEKDGAYHILSMISMAADFIEDISGTAPQKVTVN